MVFADSVLLVPIFIPPLLLLADTMGAMRIVSLYVGQGDIHLRMFELVVLVQAALGTIRLPTGLVHALVVTLDLVRVPSHPLILFVAPFT